VKVLTTVARVGARFVFRDEGVTLLAGEEEVGEYWMNEQ
jgi:hypothetical protein